MRSRRNAITSLVTLLSSNVASGYIMLSTKTVASCRLSRHGCACLSKSYFHSRLKHVLSDSRLLHSTDDNTADGDPRERARDAFSKLAKRGRSWKRLRHIIDLACLFDTEQIRSVADIGCDHGLLSLGLAVSGRFDRVIGVDVSEQALNDGASALLRNLKNDDRWSSLSQEQLNDLFPVEFVVGDGVLALEPGQVEGLCIAGMGVNTMIRILDPSELERIGCKSLILQPTNSRPRNLMRLYDHLVDSGWTAFDERIEQLSSRWYITTLFTQAEGVSGPAGSNEMDIPGQFLAPSNDAYKSYVEHHQQWIKKDSLTGPMHASDRRWLASVDKLQQQQDANN